ncbi:MAG TPA: UvrD-helicase domain-containing protein [Candidatus Paceibacterota bacterium]|nr:UvrD-helicase domain-containing protein [Candidatus Paceibacterota bacterium]
MHDEHHLEGLNAAQKNAVLTTEGPLLVLAGAGSGKTRVITHRIIHLILTGTAPERILAVTFTNKAAKEMHERAMDLLRRYRGSERASWDAVPTVTTFHALGVRMLREHHEVLGIKKHFTIYDRSDSSAAMKKALVRAGYDPKEFEPRRMLSMVSRAKGDAILPAEFLEKAKSFPARVAGEAWKHYEDILREEHALDFDDLLSKTLAMLRNHPPILASYRERYAYVHVDEYQDTNRVQFEIARLIVGERGNLCVVGDVDQNIYSWRGADVKNILQFERHFPAAKVIMLEENYRSTQTIIEASNDVIEKNVNRPEKKVFTRNHPGELISLYAGMGGADEAEYVAGTAKELIKNGANPSDIAVLFRTNFQSRVLEEAFIAYEVPYQMLGTKFFERKEVKDVLSYLRYAMNPDSTADLARIINTPARGIGKVTVLKVVEGKAETLPRATREKVEAFEKIIEDIRAYAAEHPVHETIAFIMRHSGIEESYKKDGEEGQERLENVREVVSLGTKYAELPPEEAVEALLEDSALGSDQDELKEREEFDAVRLMTIHAAKGLEFAYVFITGLEEGLFPHERLDAEGVDEEEERRLFYVALTRAKKKVFLSYAHMRTIFGSQRVNVPSSFLSDIRSELIESANPGESGFERTIWLD